MTDTLHVAREGDVVVVTIDRPSHRNALDKPLWDALRREGIALQDDAPRVVILTGEGAHFCAGMDLSPTNPLLQELLPLVTQGDTYRLAELIRGLKACFGVWTRIPAPVICAVEGACYGAGLELALTADLRVAAESAVFSLPETRFGMVPDVGGTVRLGKLVGTSRAAQLILTAGQVGAVDAERWGLVNEVVPDGSALERAHAIAESILKCSPAATKQAVLALRQCNSLGDGERFEHETEAGALALTSGEVVEGVTSFAQKRDANW